MHRLLKIFLAILLTGTVVAVVAGILLASTYQFKFTSLSGSSQGQTHNEEKQLTPDGGESSFARVRDAVKRKRKISKAARTTASVEAHVGHEDTTQNSSGQSQSQRQAGKLETISESLEGFKCMPEAAASSSEDTAERCPPPYLCIAEKPDSAVGRCRHPDSLPRLHESCDPANTDGCGPGLRCSKATKSCEPALLLGEGCDPSDEAMCLSGWCRRSRSSMFIKNQTSTSSSTEEAEAKRSITEHAETGNGNDYVCQIDATCGQPCDSALRLCSGRCNVCGKDGLCESNSSTQNQLGGLLPTALQLPREEVDNRSAGDGDTLLERGSIEDSNNEDGQEWREVDKGPLQASEEGVDKGERHKNGDRESQRRKREEEGEAGAHRERPGSLDKGESDESHYEGEISVQKPLESASEDKRKQGRVDLEHNAKPEAGTTRTSNNSDNSRAGDWERAPSAALENKSETDSRAAQGDFPRSGQKQHPRSTVLPRGRQQTVNREEDKPQQQAEDAENIGDLQNEVSGQPVQQPERQPSSSHYSVPLIRAEADEHIDQTHIQRAPGTPELERGKPQGYYVHVVGDSVTHSTASNPATSTGQPPGPTTVVKPVRSLSYDGNQQEGQKSGERSDILWPPTPETVVLPPARGRSANWKPPFNTQLQRTQRQRFQLDKVQPLQYQERRAHRQQRAHEQRPVRQQAIGTVTVRQNGQQYKAQQQHDAVQVELQERGYLEEDGNECEKRHQEREAGRYAHLAQTHQGLQRYHDTQQQAPLPRWQTLLKPQKQQEVPCALGKCEHPPQLDAGHREPGGRQHWQQVDRLRQQHTHAGLFPFQQEAAPQAQQKKSHRWAYPLSNEESHQQQVLHPLPGASGWQLQHRNTGKIVGPWQRGGQFWQQQGTSDAQRLYGQKRQPAQYSQEEWLERHQRPPQPSPQLPRIRGKSGSHQEQAGLHHQNMWQLRQRQQQAGHQQPPLQAANALPPQQNHQDGLPHPRLQHNEGLLLRQGDADKVSVLLGKQLKIDPPPPLRRTAIQEPALQQMPAGLPSTTVGADVGHGLNLPEAFNALRRAGKLAMQRFLDLLDAVPAVEQSMSAA